MVAERWVGVVQALPSPWAAFSVGTAALSVGVAGVDGEEKGCEEEDGGEEKVHCGGGT